MTRPRRLLVVVLVFLAGSVVGAIAWELLESRPVGPPFRGRVPEPCTRARTVGYSALATGAAIVAEDAATLTLRAWAPTARVAVAPRDGVRVRVIVHNIPARARLVAAPEVEEESRGGARVVSAPGTRPWEFLYAAPPGSARFAVVGDTGASDPFVQALRRARELQSDFAIVVGDLAYRDRDVPPLRAILDDAPIPVYVVRGNHDYASGVRRDFVGGLTPAYYAFGWAAPPSRCSIPATS